MADCHVKVGNTQLGFDFPSLGAAGVQKKMRDNTKRILMGAWLKARLEKAAHTFGKLWREKRG